MQSEKNRIDTRLVHQELKNVTEAREISDALILSTTFRQKSFADMSGYGYARANNPTREAFENVMASLEHGYQSFAFASGMAAIHAAFSLLNSGEKVLILGSIYGGGLSILDENLSGGGIKSEVISSAEISEIEKHVTSDTKMLYFESPTNPTLKVNDIRAIAEYARANNLISVIDNTFMSPYLQRPLELGVDVVVESATKYLGGHSDIIGGVVTVRDESLVKRFSQIQKHGGAIMQPFDAHMLLRSIKTLGIRLDRQADNAKKLAVWLKGNPAVTVVHYPGLESDEGYELQKTQARSGGGMISFELSEDYNLERFFDSLKLIIVAGSLGSVESLISHPISTSHSHVPKEIRERMGISDRLVRLSVGIEDSEDLIKDVDQALKSAES